MSVRERAADVLTRFERGAPHRPTLTEADVRRAEEALGPLPSIVRELYLRCGNGGFLPGARPLVADDDAEEQAFEDKSIVEATLGFRGDAEDAPDYPWPPGLLCFFPWGCAIESCIDVRTDLARVVRFDPNEWGDPDADDDEDPIDDPLLAYPERELGPIQVFSFKVECASLLDWLEHWMEGHSPSVLQQMTPQHARLLRTR